MWRKPMASGNQENNSSDAASCRQGVRFALLFTTAALLAAWGMTPLFRPARRLTIAITTALGNLLGLVITSTGDIITVNGFDMQVVDQCTSLNYMVILALAMLLYTRHPLSYRVQGVAVATGILLIVNALRLITLGLAGPVSMKLFSTLHENVWVALFAPLVFIIWKLWADRSITISKEKIKPFALAAGGFLAAIFLLTRFNDGYCRLLALLATPIFKLMLGNTSSAVAWNGAFTYNHGHDSLQAGLYFDEYTLPLFIGLMLPHVWRNRKALQPALLGLAALLAISGSGVALLGVIGMVSDYATAQTFMYISSGISLALPLAFYWLITGRMNNEQA